ncbi:MAG: hypothetical protein AAF764_07675, partial [Pseudomonadota bacterium]
EARFCQIRCTAALQHADAVETSIGQNVRDLLWVDGCPACADPLLTAKPSETTDVHFYAVISTTGKRRVGGPARLRNLDAVITVTFEKLDDAVWIELLFARADTAFRSNLGPTVEREAHAVIAFASLRNDAGQLIVCNDYTAIALLL